MSGRPAPGAPAEDDRTATFERARSRLLRLAYATLGSRAEAEDVVQEAWLRARRVEWATIREPEAWLTTVVGRLALDELGSARARRERYVGTWLPEPLVGADPGTVDPVAEEVVAAEQVSIALLVVMERMAPAERVAFVLHDVFGMPFADVATALDRSPEAVRALASRGRRRVLPDHGLRAPGCADPRRRRAVRRRDRGPRRPHHRHRRDPQPGEAARRRGPGRPAVGVGRTLLRRWWRRVSGPAAAASPPERRRRAARPG